MADSENARTADDDNGDAMSALNETATGWWRDLRVAAAYLTRLPLPDGEAGDLPLRASRAFGLVGAAIGIAGAVIFWIAAELGVPLAATALLALGAMIAVTGALHERGLAAAAEGICRRAPVDRRLEIMAAGEIGTLGVLVLILSVGLRVAALASFAEPGMAAVALVAAAAASRGALPVLAWQLKPVKADEPASTIDPTTATVGGLLGALIALLCLGPAAGIAAVIIGGAAAVLVGALAQHLIGGRTEQTFGATQQAVEIAILLTAAAV